MSIILDFEKTVVDSDGNSVVLKENESVVYYVGDDRDRKTKLTPISFTRGETDIQVSYKLESGNSPGQTNLRGDESITRECEMKYLVGIFKKRITFVGI